MVHTMMPIARPIALGMSAALTLAYMGLAIGLGPQGQEGQFYQQVRMEGFENFACYYVFVYIILT